MPGLMLARSRQTMEWRSLVPELLVADFQNSLRFYVSVLGFTVKYQRVDPMFAYLEFEAAQLMLAEVREDSWVVGALAHPFGRGLNLQIECSDIAEIRSRIAAASIVVFLELHDACYEAAGTTLRQRQFLVADPDGYLLRFCQVIGERSRGV
jgi:catechol 2,3-dioxygenase-like lactoylglutathione lyase family enzyme